MNIVFAGYTEGLLKKPYTSIIIDPRDFKMLKITYSKPIASKDFLVVMLVLLWPPYHMLSGP